MILSTGMSTMEQIGRRSRLRLDAWCSLTATSTYPCNPSELNLHMIATLRDEYSRARSATRATKSGLQTTVAAVRSAPASSERHITLDRAMWGSDQAASVEPAGLRGWCATSASSSALGDGVKRVHDSELASQARLRRI